MAASRARSYVEAILVVGAYGYRNVGDEAILAGLLNQLTGSRVTVVSRMPAETTALHGVRSVPISQAISELRRHQTLLIGGGGLFGRDMGRLGRLLPFYGLLARASGHRVVLEGLGIDRSLPFGTRQLVRALAASAERVVVRDEASLAVMRGWKIDAMQAPDLSSLMPEIARSFGEQLLRAAGVDLRRPVIGLCLTAIDERLFAAVARAVTASVQRLPEAQFVFIPMSQHPFANRHNDLQLGRALRAACQEVRILEGVHHPAAVLSVFGSLTAAVCMRYHSLLFADRVGIPIIPFAYADKCRTWLAERGRLSTEPTGVALTTAIADLLPAVRMAG